MDQKMIEVNGKLVSKEEALAWINHPDTKITHFSMEMEPNRDKDGPVTDEGFGIDKDYMATFSKQMDEMNAGHMLLSFKNSRKLGGKDLYLVFIAPGYLTRWQKFWLWVAQKAL